MPKNPLDISKIDPIRWERSVVVRRHVKLTQDNFDCWRKAVKHDSGARWGATVIAIKSTIAQVKQNHWAHPNIWHHLDQWQLLLDVAKLRRSMT